MSPPHDAALTHLLGVKESADDAALAITESAMRVCGGADGRAGSVKAPTANALYDFSGKAITGLRFH